MTRTRALLTLIVIALALAACGDRQPHTYEGRAFYGVGTLYVQRNEYWQVTAQHWCWLWDETCNGNPWGYPIPNR